MPSIAIVDTLGLCYDGTTLTKRGLGGSESAVILISKELAALGFDVKVFNDCYSDDAKPGVYDGVEYIPVTNIDQYPDGFDVFVASRSVVSFAPDSIKHEFKWANKLPNIESVALKSRYKVLWMHDTFCDGDDYIEDFIMQGRIDKVFTLSDWHTTYITNCDHGRRRNFEVLKKHIFQTRNGMTRYIDWVDIKTKDPNLFVYNSSVTKGLYPLVDHIWPRVKEQIPDARLKVIGGYYRFRSDHGPDQQEKDWRAMADDPTHASRDVEFLGIIPQSEIAEILSKASYMIYPAAFPETFGISTLESLAYNTPLITCRFGALEETAVDMACYKIPYAIEPNGLFPDINKEEQCRMFAEEVVRHYHNPYLHQQKMYACNQIRGVEGWDTVALQWKQHFYNTLGLFLPIREYRKVKEINNRVRKVFGRRFCNEEDQSISKLEERKIHIVTPVYNAEKYIENCILSVISQDYTNYTMYIIDDNSTDNTLDVIDETLKDNYFRGEIQVQKRDKRTGSAVRSQFETIKANCNPNDIVMLLDGDDWLVNDPNIFNMYNNLYDNGAEFTYGSCWSLADNIPLVAQPYPPEVKENRSYRSYKFNWNMPYTHLRTFLAGLVPNEGKFKDENGEWFKSGGDNAMFYNIIENASPAGVVCVSDIVYNYNDLNPLNDYKVNSDEQNKTAGKILDNMYYSKSEEKSTEPVDVLEKEFQWAKNLTQSDIYQHLDVLKQYADKCDSVTEFGVRDGMSTRALLCSEYKTLRSYDLYLDSRVTELFNIARENGRDCSYEVADTLKLEIEPTDLLFIDTDHTYPQLSAELKRHHTKVRKYIAFHDTYTFGLGNRENDNLGLLTAIMEFMQENPEWKVVYHTTENNGFTILEKKPVKDKKLFSVVVPTMWRVNDLFQRVLKQYVEHELVGEIIIIDNDKERTPDWSLLKHEKVRMFTQKENIRVNPAWNLGVRESRYDLINIVNDDILVDLDVLYKLQDRLTPDSGPYGCISGEAKFDQPPTTDYSIDFIEWRPGDTIHHFGQCMFLHKSTWTPIIDGLDLYFGDDFIFHTNLQAQRTPVLIYNIRQETPCAGTTKDPAISGGFFEKEQPVYAAWAADKQIDFSYMEGKEKLIPKVNGPVRKGKILIGIPTAKYIESETFKSIYDLKVPEGYEVQFQTFYGYNIDQVRNLIADWVVRGFDYLLSVDSDIVLPPDALEKMLKHDKDMVTGIYRQRLPQQTLEVYDMDQRNIPADKLPKNELVRIGGCGFGCVLVKNKVFTDVGYPQFEYHSAIDHKDTFSEDNDFCKKATAKGFEIFADTSIICDHKGTKMFSVEL